MVILPRILILKTPTTAQNKRMLLVPRFGESWSTCLCVQVVETILECEELGVVHRDIKDENILVTTRQRGPAPFCSMCRNVSSISLYLTKLYTLHLLVLLPPAGRVQYDHRNNWCKSFLVSFIKKLATRFANPFSSSTEEYNMGPWFLGVKVGNNEVLCTL